MAELRILVVKGREPLFKPDAKNITELRVDYPFMAEPLNLKLRAPDGEEGINKLNQINRISYYLIINYRYSSVEVLEYVEKKSTTSSL